VLPKTSLLAGVTLAASIWTTGVAAGADTYRLTDGDGVVHLTNAPTDPRYRGLPVVSGTASGWLRMTETSQHQFSADIREISSRHGVDPLLVESVIRAESAFNPSAVSIMCKSRFSLEISSLIYAFVLVVASMLNKTDYLNYLSIFGLFVNT